MRLIDADRLLERLSKNLEDFKLIDADALYEILEQIRIGLY